MAKVLYAAKSASLLLDTGDLDGACNRAYYAMFDAARAALITADIQPAGEAPRSHSGLVSVLIQNCLKERWGGSIRRIRRTNIAERLAWPRRRHYS